MPPRLLSPEERALWRTLTRTVTPLRRFRQADSATATDEPARPASTEAPIGSGRAKGRMPSDWTTADHMPPPAIPPRPTPVPVLDGSWEKKIRAGQLSPDTSIDLHGLTLAAAHMRLERLLGDAVLRGWRVLLVVTGKPRPAPLPGEARKRGAIRAEIGDWLARSPQASRIASVRQAHPRHGGDGALYIILRR